MEHVLPSELDTNFHFHWITLIIHVKNTKQDLVETTLLKLKDLRIIGLTGFGFIILRCASRSLVIRWDLEEQREMINH